MCIHELDGCLIFLTGLPMAWSTDLDGAGANQFSSAASVRVSLPKLRSGSAYLDVTNRSGFGSNGGPVQTLNAKVMSHAVTVRISLLLDLFTP